jgi:uncharacterized protein YndB with AHSA1/START domain
MPELRAGQELAAPADAVWRLLEDFGAIERWWPTDGPATIEQVVIEGEGVGMIRHIRNRGATEPVSERLDFIEPATRTLMLSIVGARPVGITAYVAEGHVVEVGAGRCRIDYRALFTATPGTEDKVGKALLKTWSLMFRGLEAAAGKP